jgi:hypothetical protein
VITSLKGMFGMFFRCGHCIENIQYTGFISYGGPAVQLRIIPTQFRLKPDNIDLNMTKRINLDAAAGNRQKIINKNRWQIHARSIESLGL